MKKTFKVYLRNGTTFKVKADDFTVTYGADGFTEWNAKGVHADKWLMFHPSDLLAVERVK